MKIVLLLIYAVFTVWTIYRVSKLAKTRSWYKCNIIGFGLPMWVLCTLIPVWFVCLPGRNSKWLCFGWFAFYSLPICLWLGCLFAKVLAFLMKGKSDQS